MTLKVVSPKKAAKISVNSTPISTKKRKKKRTTGMGVKNETTVENTTEKPMCTGEALDMLEGEKAQTSTTKPRSVEHSCFDDKVGHKLPAAYTKP